MIILKFENFFNKFVIGVFLFICVLFFDNKNVYAVKAELSYNSNDYYLTMYTASDWYTWVYGSWADCYHENGKKNFVLFFGKTYVENINKDYLNGDRVDTRYIGDWETGNYTCKRKVQTQENQNSEGEYKFYHTKDPKAIEKEKEETKNKEEEYKELIDKDKNLYCDSLGYIKKDLQNIFDFVKVLAPLLVIGFSTYEFVKAIAAKDSKDIKRAFSTLIKRMICAIILFFLPILIEFFLDLLIDINDICID